MNLHRRKKFLSLSGRNTGVVLYLFGASEHMLAIGILARRIPAVFYLVSIPNLIYAAVLQGMSFGTKSMCLKMTRQAILPILLVFARQGFGNLPLIWTVFVLAELVSVPIVVFRRKNLRWPIVLRKRSHVWKEIV